MKGRVGGLPWVREWEAEGGWPAAPTGHSPSLWISRWALSPDSPPCRSSAHIRLRENEKAGNPFGLPAFPYDYRERRGKMVCVAQALCLMDSSYPRRREKSTGFCDPSQFVYNQTDFGTFRLQFVQE